MKTSISISDSTLIPKIHKWNKANPDKKIGISGVCEQALAEALARARGNSKTDTPLMDSILEAK